MNPFKVAFIGRKLIPADRAMDAEITATLCELFEEKEFVEIHISRGCFFGDVCTFATSMAGRTSGKSNFRVVTLKSYPSQNRFLSYAKQADLIFSFVAPDEEAADAVRLAESLGKTVIHLEVFSSFTLDKRR